MSNPRDFCGIPGVHAVGQMAGAGEMHCPQEVLHPSLAAENLDEALD